MGRLGSTDSLKVGDCIIIIGKNSTDTTPVFFVRLGVVSYIRNGYTLKYNWIGEVEIRERKIEGFSIFKNPVIDKWLHLDYLNMYKSTFSIPKLQKILEDYEKT